MELFQFETPEGSLIVVKTVEKSPRMREMAAFEAAARKEAGVADNVPMRINIDMFDSKTDERLDPEEEMEVVSFRVYEIPNAIERYPDGGVGMHAGNKKGAMIGEGDAFTIRIKGGRRRMRFVLLAKRKAVLRRPIIEFW